MFLIGEWTSNSAEKRSLIEYKSHKFKELVNYDWYDHVFNYINLLTPKLIVIEICYCLSYILVNK